MKVATLCLTAAVFVGGASADPLAGHWILNVGRTHYGGGAETRKRETFICDADKQLLRCTIDSVRSNGKRVVASFAAAYDGKPYAVTGIPDIDRVSRQR